MKLKANLTFLINSDKTRIEIEDDEAHAILCIIELTPAQLSTLLSRTTRMDCEMEVFDLNKIGKKHGNKTFVFELPDANYMNRKEVAIETIKTVCPDGWTPDIYFGSQNSFFRQDGKEFARVTIRRWVDKDITP